MAYMRVMMLAVLPSLQVVCAGLDLTSQKVRASRVDVLDGGYCA